jgi:hypothetical protein
MKGMRVYLPPLPGDGLGLPEALARPSPAPRAPLAAGASEDAELASWRPLPVAAAAALPSLILPLVRQPLGCHDLGSMLDMPPPLLREEKGARSGPGGRGQAGHISDGVCVWR